ncbi:uncharacterized protein [Neodiprion pinetum]|uniref:uncharacterized protein n=1 Tax=Neodiprion pinetum TaxID=441929 RepID=UPI003719D6C2
MRIALRRFREPGSLLPGFCAPGPLPGATRLPGQALLFSALQVHYLVKLDFQERALRSFCAPGGPPGETRLPGQALRIFCAPGPLPRETRLSEDEEDEENKMDEKDEDLCTESPSMERSADSEGSLLDVDETLERSKEVLGSPFYEEKLRQLSTGQLTELLGEMESLVGALSETLIAEYYYY